MSRLRASLKCVATGVLAVPLLLGAGAAMGSTQQWSFPSVLPTDNDGLEVSEVSLRGQSMLYSASTPFFELNGQKYEFKDAYRVAGPALMEADGFAQVVATYAVPVSEGTVTARIAYTLVDQADEGSDDSQVSAWVQFEGPTGDYHFFWRLDPDVGSRTGTRPALLDGADMTPVLTESVVALGDRAYGIIDLNSYLEGTQLQLEPNPADGARVYTVAFHPGEADTHPRDLVDGESLERQGRTVDFVLWYETVLHDVSSGLTGPDMYARAAYRVNALVEQDKMTSVSFIEDGTTVYDEYRSMQSGFATAGINILDVKQDKSNIANDSSTTNAELHSIMLANKTYEYQDSTSQWYSWVGTVIKSSSGMGVLGIMFDDGSTNTDGKPRQGCAVFYEAHDTSWPEGDSMQAELLLSMTHETGHVYNQHHEDFCPGRVPMSKFKKGSSIMGYAFNNTNYWTFSTGSIYTMSSEAEQWSRPGHGVDFTTNGSYNMTDAHASKHVSTSCRWFCCFNQ